MNMFLLLALFDDNPGEIAWQNVSQQSTHGPTGIVSFGTVCLWVISICIVIFWTVMLIKTMLAIMKIANEFERHNDREYAKYRADYDKKSNSSKDNEQSNELIVPLDTNQSFE